MENLEALKERARELGHAFRIFNEEEMVSEDEQRREMMLDLASDTSNTMSVMLMLVPDAEDRKILKDVFDTNAWPEEPKYDVSEQKTVGEVEALKTLFTLSSKEAQREFMDSFCHVCDELAEDCTC